MRFNCDGHIFILFVFPQFTSFHPIVRYIARNIVRNIALKTEADDSKVSDPHFIELS